MQNNEFYIINRTLFHKNYVYSSLLKNEKNRLCTTRFLSVNTAGVDRPGVKIQSVARPNGMVDFQLIYLFAGQGSYYNNAQGRWEPFNAGEFIVFSPNMPQFYRYNACSGVEAFWVHFSGNGAESLLRELQLQPGKSYKTAQFSPKLFKKIIKAALIGGRHAPVQAAGYLAALLARLADAAQTGNFVLEGEDYQKIQPAIEYLKLHSNAQVNNRQLANLCHLSQSRFCHLFKTVVGVSPAQYRLNLKMQLACRLLEETDYSIRTIAESTGYQDPLYFSKAFKEKNGLSPKQFRQQSR